MYGTVNKLLGQEGQYTPSILCGVVNYIHF
jgi:hypothetical protein